MMISPVGEMTVYWTFVFMEDFMDTDDKIIQQDLSNETKLEIWLDECDLGEIPDDWYREDPISRPTITVKEAYDLNLLSQGVKLYVHWAAPHESEEYPPRRVVTGIDKRANNAYDVHAQGLHNFVDGRVELQLSVEGLQAQLLFGAWLKMHRMYHDALDMRFDAENKSRDMFFSAAHSLFDRIDIASSFNTPVRNEDIDHETEDEVIKALLKAGRIVHKEDEEGGYFWPVTTPSEPTTADLSKCCECGGTARYVCHDKAYCGKCRCEGRGK